MNGSLFLVEHWHTLLCVLLVWFSVAYGSCCRSHGEHRQYVISSQVPIYVEEYRLSRRYITSIKPYWFIWVIEKSMSSPKDSRLIYHRDFRRLVFIVQCVCWLIEFIDCSSKDIDKHYTTIVRTHRMNMTKRYESFVDQTSSSMCNYCDCRRFDQ
jgi:hypothetical protein